MIEELPLLASFLPEVRESLEGKQSLCPVWKGGEFLGERRMFVPGGYRLYCVLCVRCIITSLLNAPFFGE